MEISCCYTNVELIENMYYQVIKAGPSGPILRKTLLKSVIVTVILKLLVLDFSFHFLI